MSMPRVGAAETLDGLAEDDPAAVHSRRDLRRVHRMMGTRTIVARALRELTAFRSATEPLRILELGAGDGTLMLGVARMLRKDCPAVRLQLLDRQKLVSAATLESYAELGWQVSVQVCDVFDWVTSDADQLKTKSAPRWDVIVVNLFLHHFEGTQLDALLGAIASRTNRFLACEPRRGMLALAGSHLIGLIGANAVTRQDAVLSVHAGFEKGEITALWPSTHANWTLNDYSAGLFSQCFCALRHQPEAG